MSDWTTEAADTIERVVSTVRDRTVVPAQRATRAIVYGLIAAFFVVPAMFLLVAGLFRVLVKATGGEVWAAWLILGGIFVLAGGFLWTKRQP